MARNPKPQRVYSPEELLRRSIAPRVSPKMKAHLRRLHKSLKGKEPKYATAGTLATRKLKKIGLTREQSPRLWEMYRDLFLRRRLDEDVQVFANSGKEA